MPLFPCLRSLVFEFYYIIDAIENGRLNWINWSVIVSEQITIFIDEKQIKKIF